MKTHNLFLESYAKIEDEKERIAFLRGYLFELSPKEMTRFLLDNFELGFQAYEQVLSAGEPLEQSAALAELDKQFALLQRHRVALVTQ